MRGTPQVRARQIGKIWQFRQRDIHAKGTRPATPVFPAPPESFGQGVCLDEMEVEELGINPRGDRGTDGFSLVCLNADSMSLLDSGLGALASKAYLVYALTRAGAVLYIQRS